ncbi:hypothetical protein GPUN_1646 [Glaciecola punicea ACAM 611]|uniref:DUF418 domain-containing protein n=1 Tax=Glaciecola punicea ACAM 611 TaxID=1121923 RepID=H5TBT6_9ALTE|nr:DUF418 domain-containing protein [Glaciecola punicea]GAB55763.1 hypothetical protein GPUN_1646 [Glaciecola punicea ACAM 611]
MRSTSIDALRGIAILGILFMNIPLHANMLLGYVSFEPMLTSDKLITLLYSIFADGRFRTLFCLLFGAGLAIQYESCITKGIDTTVFLKSRLHWLMFFGLIHGVFIFGGDILMLYSLSGLLLIRGLTLDTEALLQKARKFLIIGCTIILLIAAATLIFADMNEQVVRGTQEYKESVALWQGNYWYQTMIHAGFSLGIVISSPLFILWQTLGLMYLGCYLYRVGFFTQGFSQPAFIKVASLALISTALCIAPQILMDNIASEIIPLISSLSAVFMALVYAHVVVKLCQTKSTAVNALAAIGKVAFSLYIMQSIFMGLLLRWIMPEFSITASHVDYLLLVLVYAVIQILMATLYLRKYEQGPLELLWRRLYNKGFKKKR